MSFSVKVSDVSVEQSSPNIRNDTRNGQSVSKKRKPQKTPGPDFKRRCLRSNSVNTNEAAPEKEEPSKSHISHRHPKVSNAHHQEHRAFRGNKGNKYYPHKKKQENAQRYKVFNKGRGGQSKQPQKLFMTQEFKDQHALEVDGRLLCKFFIQGRCTKGEECQLEHSETYNDLIKVACKFYIQGTCNKGATCPYMHMSVPCKFFHIKSRCNSSDNCRFSHDPLTDVTQKVLDALTQRDNELYELNRKAREPQSQTVNEEQNTNEGIVIPAVRPSFYQSLVTTVEDEQSQPYNELQSEITEDSAAETETISKSEDSLPLDQPGPVCYSVEALLGPQLFKPVLYTATVSQKSTVSPPKSTTTKTETLLDPVDAPYSVASVLRSQSMFRSYLHAPQSVEPAAASCELTETQTTVDKYKVSHFKQQNTQEKFFKQTSPHVPPESRPDDVHCLTKAHKVNNETHMGEITAPNLKPVAEQSTAEYERQHCMEIGGSMSQKCEVSKKVTIDKLDESGQGSKMFEDTTISSFSSKKSGIVSLQREQDTQIQQIHETNKARKDLAIARNLKPVSEGMTTTNQKNLETTSEMDMSDQSAHITQNVLEKRQRLDAGLPTPQHKSTSRFSHLFANLNSNPDPISRDNRCSSDKPVSPKCDSGSLKVRQQIKQRQLAKTPTKAEITTAEIQENPQTTIEITTDDQSTHSTYNVSENRKDCQFDAILPSQEKTTSRFSHLFANLNSESDQTFHASSYSRDKPVIPKSNSATKATIKDCPNNHNAGPEAERSKKSLDNFDKSVSLPPSGTEMNSKDNRATKDTVTALNPTLAAIKTMATIHENLKTNREITVTDQPTQTFQDVSQRRQVCEFVLSHHKPRSKFSHLFAKLDSDSDRTFSASSGSSDDPFTPNHEDIDKDSIKTKDAGLSAKRTETLQEVEHKKEDGKSVKTPSRLFLNLFKSLTADADRPLTISNPLSDKATTPYTEKVEKSTQNLQKSPRMTKTVQIMNSIERNAADVGFVTPRAEISHNFSQKPFTSNLKRECDKQRAKPPSQSFQSPFASLSTNLEGTSSNCDRFSGKPAVTSVHNIQQSKRVDCSFTQTTKAVQFPRRRTESSDNGDSRVKYVTASPETSNNSCQQSVSSAMPDLKNKDSVERVKTPPKSDPSLCEAPLKEPTVNKRSKMSAEQLQCAPQGERRRACSESTNKMTEKRENGASSSSPHMSNKTSASQSPPHQSNSGSHSSVFKTLFKQLRPCDQE